MNGFDWCMLIIPVPAWSVFAWTMWGLFIFPIQFGGNSFLGRWSEATWFARFEYHQLPLNLTYGAVTVWFCRGGVRDVFRRFRTLGGSHRDRDDNGMVRKDRQN